MICHINKDVVKKYPVEGLQSNNIIERTTKALYKWQL